MTPARATAVSLVAAILAYPLVGGMLVFAVLGGPGGWTEFVAFLASLGIPIWGLLKVAYWFDRGPVGPSPWRIAAGASFVGLAGLAASLLDLFDSWGVYRVVWPVAGVALGALGGYFTPRVSHALWLAIGAVLAGASLAWPNPFTPLLAVVSLVYLLGGLARDARSRFLPHTVQKPVQPGDSPDDRATPILVCLVVFGVLMLAWFLGAISG